MRSERCLSSLADHLFFCPQILVDTSYILLYDDIFSVPPRCGHLRVTESFVCPLCYPAAEFRVLDRLALQSNGRHSLEETMA